MFFSHQEEFAFFKSIREYIRYIKANPPKFKDVGANSATHNALVDAHEARLRRIEGMDERNPYFGFLVSDSFTGYIGKIGINVSNPDYIPNSHHVMHEDLGGQVIVHFESKIARPYVYATAKNPQGIDGKRKFIYVDGELVDFQDEDFRDINDFFFDNELEDIADEIQKPILDKSLEAVINAPRRDTITSIASTMSRQQYAITEIDPNAWMSLQGGPGTGKTVLALHRLSMISYRRQEMGIARRANDELLFIAPSNEFLRYVENLVAFELGKTDVVHKSYYDVFGVRYDYEESDYKIKELKSDIRMKDLAKYVVWNRMYPTKELVFDFESISITLGLRELIELCDEARESNETYVDAQRYLFRVLFELVMDKFQTASSDVTQNSSSRQGLILAMRDVEEFRKKIRFNEITRSLAPSQTAEELHKRLMTNPVLLRAAWRSVLAHDYESDDENPDDLDIFIKHLVMNSAEYRVSNLDVPLIFVLRCEISGSDRTWTHIAIDEVQDRCPLDLYALKYLMRKDTGLTLLGDLAQNTEPWVYSSWDGIWESIGLEGDDAERIKKYSLNYSYRVPGDILEYAQQFRNLTEVEPASLEAVKDNSISGLIQVNLDSPYDFVSLSEQILETLKDMHPDVTVCVIASPQVVPSLKAFFAAEFDRNVKVMELEETKGLEFDVVVVHNPIDLVAHHLEGEFAKKLSYLARKLWIAYTRGTQKLIEANVEGNLSIFEFLDEHSDED